MTQRYTVSENLFGYEADVGAHRLKFAVTDNKPDQTTVYMAAKRERVLMTGAEAAHYLSRPVTLPPFRHVCYTSVREDAERLVGMLNAIEDAKGPSNDGAFTCEACGLDIERSSHGGPLCLKCKHPHMKAVSDGVR